ncbi:hypothetical protein GVN18_43895 [Pseudomonas sp. ODNR1LW]|nr:hypothetical protein [Pseudomonas sp. ODNR1LW]
MKRMKREGFLLGTLALAALGLMIVAAQLRGSAPLSMAAFGFGLAVLGLTLVLAVDLWGRREADREAVTGGLDRDQVQSAEALGLVFLAALGLLYTAFGVDAAWRIASGLGDLDDWKPALACLAMPLAVMSVMLGGKVWQRRAGALPKAADELTIHFRRSATAWAFRVSLASVAVVYVAGLFQPPLTVAGMPAVFEVAAMTAALRYWWLDRQASRG